MDLFTLFIVILVIGSRLLVPLLIPRYPLPAIIAALVIDGIDQSVFQQFTSLNLDGYQNYDKALDIYYLSIAYLSTFRNWTNQVAFQISQFLFYYRMVGDTLFQITDIRALLFIFPNTFEYFFIFISAIALFWNMDKLKKKFLILSAAFIWIFIKLPQEYWIHIAQLDTTDFIKETILGVPATSSWSYALSQNLWVIPAFVIIFIALGVIIYKVIKLLPKPDHNLEWSPKITETKKSLLAAKGFLGKINQGGYHFIEKMIFSGLLFIIFAHIFPDFKGSNIELAFGAVFIIFINSLISHFINSYTRFTIRTVDSFISMFFLNFILAFVYAKYIDQEKTESMMIILFFAYTITLITVLYDRFKPFYLARFAK